MNYGSLFKNNLHPDVSYCYRKHNRNTSFNPDLSGEPCERDTYDKNSGSLFFGKTVAWKAETLLNDSVDICISIGKEIFADHIILHQGEGSEFKSIEVFTQTESGVKKLAEYRGENGNPVNTSHIRINIGYTCDNLSARINGSYQKLIIEKLDLLGAWDMETIIFPTPQEAHIKDCILTLADYDTLTASDEDSKFAANYFCEMYAEKNGVTLSVAEDSGKIRILCDHRDDESYDIEVTSASCTISAGSRTGLLYAMCTLLSLSGKDGIKTATISDKPFMQFRGAHFALPQKSEKELFKNIVRYILVPMRYNAVIFEIASTMRYENYPEINSVWLDACRKYENGEAPKPAHYAFLCHEIWEKDEIEELCDFLRSYGIDVIPEVQTWGHTQYITSAYPHLAELDDDMDDNVDLFIADEKTAKQFRHCMCPSHPEYYEYTLGIATEVIDTFKPRKYVHMGHDEIFYTAICGECKEKGLAKLYEEEVTKLNEYVKSKGLKMIIWSDMLQEKNRYESVRAINKIPKDILMMDFTWYFHPDEDIEDNLLEHGFDIIIGNLYSSHFPRYESRSHKPGIFGAEVSTWVECKEKVLAIEGKMFDLIYSAELMWNGLYNSQMRLSYTEAIKPLLWNIRTKIGSLPDENKWSNVSMDTKPVYGSDLTALCCNGTSPEVTITSDLTAEWISVIHASDKPVARPRWQAGTKIGEYVFEYEDGSKASEDIIYSLNIMQIRTQWAKPIKSWLYRHEGYEGTYYTKPHCGKLADGSDYTLSEHYIKNPYPQKKIKNIILKKEADMNVSIMLFELKKY